MSSNTRTKSSLCCTTIDQHRKKKGKVYEFTEILDLKMADFALMRGFGAGVERAIDAYIRNATEWNTFL